MSRAGLPSNAVPAIHWIFVVGTWVPFSPLRFFIALLAAIAARAG